MQRPNMNILVELREFLVVLLFLLNHYLFQKLKLIEKRWILLFNLTLILMCGLKLIF